MNQMARYIKRILFCVIIGVCSMHVTVGQSILGNTGMIRVPTAKFEEDGTLILGSSFFDKKFLSYSQYEFDAVTAYANLTFLPFLELGLRYTRQINRPEYTRLFADRMPFFKLRVLQETDKLPTVAIGMNDFLTSVKEGNARHFAAQYLVMTKTIEPENLPWQFQVSAGYGFRIGKAQNFDLAGVFGGVQIRHEKAKWVGVIMEYDARHWNTGLDFLFFKHLHLAAALRNMNTLEANLAYKIFL